MLAISQNDKKKEKDNFMKKLVVITSGMYPSHGVLNLVKYISYSLINNKTFRKKYDLKILVFYENIFLRLKKDYL